MQRFRKHTMMKRYCGMNLKWILMPEIILHNPSLLNTGFITNQLRVGDLNIVIILKIMLMIFIGNL